MNIDFEWNLNREEILNILSKLKTIFVLHESQPVPNQFISKSPTFSDNECKSGTKWYLEITSGIEHYIQLKLCLQDTEKLTPLCITYKLVFKTQIERTSFESEAVLNIRNLMKINFPEKFLNAHYFLTLASNNYDLSFVCKMQVQAVQGRNNTLDSIQKDYEKLLSDTKYSDFMLVTSTKKFNVHKMILAARSEVFAAMFEHDMKETQEGFAEIKEFDDEVVQEFLRYIYCGKVENLDKFAEDLLAAAEKYLMFNLKVLCLEEICEHINTENAVELLVLVDNHHVEHLRSSMINFIVENIKDSTIKSNLATIENGKLSNEILRKTVDKYI